MIKLQRILVAVDFSEHADLAARYAAEFGRAFDAEVLLCHVVEEPALIAQLPPGGEGYFPPNVSELQIERAEKLLSERLAQHGIVKGRILTAVGKPFVEIVRLARGENVDLIIVGTHGRGAIAHMLLGSVAEKIVRKAPCPVLVVREGEHDFLMP